MESRGLFLFCIFLFLNLALMVPVSFSNIFLSQVPDNVPIAALVLVGSMLMEGNHSH